MARITVEDCIEKIPNRFQLILLAAERTRQINNGAETKMGDLNDRHTVMALREVAESEVQTQDLEDTLIGNLQKVALQENLLQEDGGFSDVDDPFAATDAIIQGFKDDDADDFVTPPTFEDVDFEAITEELGDLPNELDEGGIIASTNQLAENEFDAENIRSDTDADEEKS
ncbi:MAG: DNA-directed RNA polymerase subunit omega [Pseudomonadota bacterium]